jgi:hypothetical protein
MDAHRPTVSRFTYAADVLPILRERCGACHIDGGVAPMPLLTHGEAFPWALAIKEQVLAGHMPPWPASLGAGVFEHASTLTARELDVLVDWASGQTPEGAPAGAPPRHDSDGWALEAPSLELALPTATTLDGDELEAVRDFTLPPFAGPARLLRGVDVAPGDARIVRRVTVSLGAADDPSAVVAVWVPGQSPRLFDPAMGYEMPAAVPVAVRVTYRKTWRTEGDTLTDRSRLGWYFASGPSPVTVRREVIAPAHSWRPTRAARVLSLLPLLPDGAEMRRVTIDVVRAGGVRETVARLDAPRPQWQRRLWLERPLTLGTGDALELATLGASSADDAAAVRVSVDIVDAN